jgi:uncharacterized protein YndB with AHSA1/START domain
MFTAVPSFYWLNSLEGGNLISEERKVRQSIIVETTPELAFEAVTKASELREWCSDEAWTEVRPGGRYEVRWNQGYRSEGTFAIHGPDHTRQHIEQIKATLETVRGG